MLTIRNMDLRSAQFFLATLTPAALLGAAAIMGGVWVVLALVMLTIVVSLLDRLITATPSREDARAATVVCVLVAGAHFLVLPTVVWAITQDHLSPLEKAGLFIAAGFWFGQISNANAHELIHRGSRTLHRLGMWVYISLLFGHHTSAHLLVHHTHVATARDPNTSRKGESLYRYILRAWGGSFRAGYLAEAARLKKGNRPARHNPYVAYVVGGLGFILAATWLGGWGAALTYVALCTHAQMQLLMSDYVQHYGLMRSVRDDGKPEPVGTRHSWNSPHWFSSAMMLNATRHSDHHAHPARPYPALGIPDDAPMLPRPLPLMASIALIPPLWRRVMHPRLKRWENA